MGTTEVDDVAVPEAPEGWTLGPSTDVHVAYVKEGNTRTHVSAHPQTSGSGWRAYARPGTGQIVAEGDPLGDVLKSVVASIKAFEESGDYELVDEDGPIEADDAGPAEKRDGIDGEEADATATLDQWV